MKVDMQGSIILLIVNVKINSYTNSSVIVNTRQQVRLHENFIKFFAV